MCFRQHVKVLLWVTTNSIILYNICYPLTKVGYRRMLQNDHCVISVPPTSKLSKPYGDFMISTDIYILYHFFPFGKKKVKQDVSLNTHVLHNDNSNQNFIIIVHELCYCFGY